MAAFGPTYPTDRKTREQFFAWSQSSDADRRDDLDPAAASNAFDDEIIALGAAGSAAR